MSRLHFPFPVTCRTHSCRSAKRRKGVPRRLALAVVLLSIFGVGFGGSFTCETNQNSSDFDRPKPPPPR